MTRPIAGNMPENLAARHLLAGTDPVAVLADLEAAAARSLRAEHAAGIVHVSLLHGDLEPDTAAALARVRQIVDAFTVADAGGQPTVIATRGGSDWTTWCLRGSRAALAQHAIVGAIVEVAPSWWRWTTTGVAPRSLSEGTGRSQSVSAAELARARARLEALALRSGFRCDGPSS